jgi:hypothetical protein
MLIVRTARRNRLRLVAVLPALFVVLPTVLPSALPSARLIGAPAVNEAIEKGIDYLLAEIRKEPKPKGDWAIGQMALETYALVVAGVSVQNQLIQQNFETLNKQAIGTNRTYIIACYVFALDAAISQLEHDLLILQPKNTRKILADDPRVGQEYRGNLAKAVQAMVRLQNKVGSWRYGPAQDFDNSNVQFAVLALGVGHKRKVPIEPAVWEGVVDHFLKYQQPDGPKVTARVTIDPEREKDRHRVTLERKEKEKKPDRKKKDDEKEGGRTVVDTPESDPEVPVVGTEGIDVFARGWDYSANKAYTWNMTCAGLSSLLLARDALGSRLNADRRKAVNKSIRDGYGFLLTGWGPTASYYSAYSLEKVADIGHIVKFDVHDWYSELSTHLLGQQTKNGSWPEGGGHHENPRVATSFALLILNRATSLLTMNPASLIVVSGRSGGGGGGVEDRAWVYVPALDVRMHYPTLLKVIRMRPTPKLVDFLRNIIDNYPDEWKGELVPDMVKIRQGLEHKALQKVLDSYLADIVGAKYKELEKYKLWHERWAEVIAAGKSAARSHGPQLIEWYGSAKESYTLKKAIIWALLQCKARDAVSLFVDDLENDDARVRAAAYDALRASFVDFPPPFDANATPRARSEQVAKIREWHKEQTART